jgi:hypothetical protein
MTHGPFILRRPRDYLNGFVRSCRRLFGGMAYAVSGFLIGLILDLPLLLLRASLFLGFMGAMFVIYLYILS